MNKYSLVKHSDHCHFVSGLSQEEVDNQFAIGKEFFSLPTEEKVQYRADLEHGNYNGYRPKGSTETLAGKRDNVEMYNVFKFGK